VPNVKHYAFLVAAAAACSTRPVVLAPVRVETPSTVSSTTQSATVFETQRDDPFATTNRIDWPGPNRYRSAVGAPGPDYWQQRADYTISASLEYIRSWAFKHPTPGDFFRSIENSTGEDLSWFWRSFFYTTDALDIGIDNVSTRTSEGQTFATISLRRNTSIPFPVRLRVAYSDGSIQDFSLPVNIWARGNVFDAVIAVRGPVTGVRLWPDASVPGWNSSNDTWGKPPRANPVGPVTRR
jgi:hypothetical protein